MSDLRRARRSWLSLLALALLAVVVFHAVEHRLTGPAGKSTLIIGSGDSVEHGLPASMPSVGFYSTSDLLGYGDLNVNEWARNVAPWPSVTLSVPTVPGLTRNAVVATDVVIRADGVRVPAPTVVASRAPVTIELPRAHEVQLSYKLSGVTREDLSSSHRALVRIITLDATWGTSTDEPELAAVRVFTGAAVLGMACTPIRGEPVPVPCGAPVQGIWEVHQSDAATRDRVQVQIQLDSPLT